MQTLFNIKDAMGYLKTIATKIGQGWLVRYIVGLNQF